MLACFLDGVECDRSAAITSGLALEEGLVSQGVHHPRLAEGVAVARRLPDGPRPDPDVRANASGSSLRL